MRSGIFIQKSTLLCTFVGVVLLLVPTTTFAQATTVITGTVTSGQEHARTIILTSGENKGDTVTVNLPTSEGYTQGSAVVLTASPTPEGSLTYALVGPDRSNPLLILFILFVIVTIGIGRLGALRALAGLTLSYLCIAYLLLPLLIQGWPPLPITCAVTSLMACILFYLSHGVHRKTTVALLSTFLTLILCGILGTLFIFLTNLTGQSSDEAAFLAFSADGASLNLKSMLLASFIIGALGVLDDITISQASIVAELKHANASLGFFEIYHRAMRVGKDHIASLINTLILVYTGASLPLLLLITTSQLPLSSLIHYEFIAEEIVRTLIGSIGLVLAVPITTLMAARFVPAAEQHRGHSH